MDNEQNEDHEGIRESQFHFTSYESSNSQFDRNSHVQMPIRPTGLYPPFHPNSATQYQQHQILPPFSYNNSFQNMSYYPHPIPPTPYTNMQFFQQSIESSQIPHTQPLSDSHSSQHSIPPRSSEPSHRNNKNWSKEEDLQLTIAWDKISTDPIVGVWQKKSELWERIMELFFKLMHEKHGVKPEDNVRRVGGCENRMNEIKAQCSKWLAARTRAMAQHQSGWSAADMEKLCHALYEHDAKTVFKWEECWNVLKDNPKWLDYANKRPGKNKRSNEGLKTRTRALSTDAPVNESAPIDLTSDTMPNEMLNTPRASNACSPSEVPVANNPTASNSCTPNLDGPASIDVERPTGIKKSKVNNQRQRRNRQHSESQASVSQSLTAGMMSLESASNTRWEMLADANRTRDLKDDERYNDMKRKQDVEHNMDVANKRSDLVLKREVVGEKLLVAIQKVDQIDPLSIVTDSQRLMFDVRKKAVEDYQEQYEELGILLKRTKNYSSPRSAPSEGNIASASVGTSQRRLFTDDVGHDKN